MLFVFARFLKGLFAFLPFIFHLFVCCSWLQLPSGTTDTWGGGGGGWKEADMPAVTALRYFHVCRKFMEICWAARNMDFVSKQKKTTTKVKLFFSVWELVRISIWTHCACAKATHIQFCSWKVSLRVQKTEQKRCSSRFPPKRSSHPRSSKPNSELEWGAICNKVLSQQRSMPKSADQHLQHCCEQWSLCQLMHATLMWAVNHVWIWWMTPAPLLWAVKHVPADTCRTDVSSQTCLNLMTDTCPTPVSSEACLNLLTDTCRTASGENEMVPTAQEIIPWPVICHHHK